MIQIHPRIERELRERRAEISKTERVCNHLREKRRRRHELAVARYDLLKEADELTAELARLRRIEQEDAEAIARPHREFEAMVARRTAAASAVDDALIDHRARELAAADRRQVEAIIRRRRGELDPKDKGGGAIRPRPHLVRARPDSIDLRDEGGDQDATSLSGHFAKFGEWSHISSQFEGTFMERIAPGAFAKTMRERRDQIRVLLNHGRDPELGDKPLGSIEELREDGVRGAFYRVRLFDGIPELVLDGVRAGAYGASFRFQTLAEEFDREPGKSEHNPEGIPERPIEEAELYEFGPVSFPAYSGATAVLRGDSPTVSLTDQWRNGASDTERTAIPALTAARSASSERAWRLP